MVDRTKSAGSASDSAAGSAAAPQAGAFAVPIPLPTAAKQPVVQHRRRGSYGKKIASFNVARRRQQQSGDGGPKPTEQPAPAERGRRALDASAYFSQATGTAPLEVAAIIDALSLAQKVELLRHRSCELTHLAMSMDYDIRRLQAMLKALEGEQ